MKEEILGYLLIKKILNFHLVTAIFKYIFELLWGLQNVLHILGCHSVTWWRNPHYHTPISRGYPELSYGPNSLNISCVIRELELEETFRWISPGKEMACKPRYDGNPKSASFPLPVTGEREGQGQGAEKTQPFHHISSLPAVKFM